MIIALAGRRVDSPDANTARFPGTPENIRAVEERLMVFLRTHRVNVIVSSAACGADLSALSAAATLHIRRIVFLPFDRDRFREISVADRPGNWPIVYDRVLDEVEKAGDLNVLHLDREKNAFAETNHKIIEEAISIGEQQQIPVRALLVWDGGSRGEDDLTEEFKEYCKARRVPVFEISTL